MTGLLIQAVAAGAYFFARQVGEFYAVAVVFGMATPASCRSTP